jgi:hypothetical protein
MGITVLDLRQRALFASLGLCICCIFTSAVLLIPKFVAAVKTGGKKGGAESRGLVLPGSAGSSSRSSSVNFKNKVRGVVGSLFGSSRSNSESEFGNTGKNHRRQSSVQLSDSAWSGLSLKELDRKLKVEEQQYAFSLQQLAKEETKVAESAAALLRRKEKVMQLMTERMHLESIELDDGADDDDRNNSVSTAGRASIKRLSAIEAADVENGNDAGEASGTGYSSNNNMSIASVASSVCDVELEMSTLATPSLIANKKGGGRYARVGLKTAASPSDLLKGNQDE